MDPAQNIGKFFNLKLDQGGTVPNLAALDRGIKRGATAHWDAQTVLTPARGGGVGTPWNFTFLKYWAGAITRCRIGAGGVLTGPMSGCILCRFNNAGGPSVAHIGTDQSPATLKTVAVKQAWTPYKASKPGGNFEGRKPYPAVINADDVLAEARDGGLTPPSGYQVWGYFRQNDAWALLIHRGNGDVNKIVKARPMALQPWASIPGHW